MRYYAFFLSLTLPLEFLTHIQNGALNLSEASLFKAICRFSAAEGFLWWWTFLLIKKIFLMFIYFSETETETETECEQGRSKERWRHRFRIRLLASSSQHRAWCRAQTHEPRDHDLSRSWTLSWLSHPGTPILVLFKGESSPSPFPHRISLLFLTYRPRESGVTFLPLLWKSTQHKACSTDWTGSSAKKTLTLWQSEGSKVHHHRGAWMPGWASYFGSGHDLVVHGVESLIGLCANS